jgi:hypothetical protein
MLSVCLLVSSNNFLMPEPVIMELSIYSKISDSTQLHILLAFSISVVK